MPTILPHDITSANAAAILTVSELYPGGIQLEQFAANTAIGIDSTQVAETRMGVDGHLAAGVIPNIFQVTINLEANSRSRKALANVFKAMRENYRPYTCNLVIQMTSTGETYNFRGGVLQTAQSMPGLETVLAPTSWVFHFESMEAMSAQ